MQKDPNIISTRAENRPNTIWTRAENRPNRQPNNSFTSPLESFGATEHMPSLCKHHLDTADAKRPKHHLDTSRKPPKPQAKKLFHGTIGSHINKIKQSKTATEHNLWSHRAHAQPVQTPCRHCRCKKTQTSSRHEPKTAQTANQKTLSRHLWNNLKQPQSTIFGATEHMPSPCKHHVDTADAKRPKHRAQTPKTSKLLGALPFARGSADIYHVFASYEPTSANLTLNGLVSRIFYPG